MSPWNLPVSGHRTVGDWSMTNVFLAHVNYSLDEEEESVCS